MAWRLVPPQYTEKWPIQGSLQFSITREETIFGNDTTLHRSNNGSILTGADEWGSIPFGTKYIWYGGHQNTTTDPVIRDLWLAHGFGAEVI